MTKKNLLFVWAFGAAILQVPVAKAVEAKPVDKAGLKSTEKPVAAPTEVLQQVKSGGVTIRLRRARWAESEEVLYWRGRGKQLTLWFDALLDPKSSQSLPQNTVPADFIVNVRLVDKRGRAIETFPVDPVRSIHRMTLPYVPAKDGLETNGQSIWRAQPFDPNFEVVKVQVEWLRPGHPFDRKTIPPSLLDAKAKAEDATPPAREWLQVLEMELSARQIEYGALSKNPAVADGESQHFKVVLYTWRRGTVTTTGGEGAGTTRPYFEVALLVRALDPGNKARLKSLSVVLHNQAGESFPMSERIGEASQWFAPNGKPLEANERVLSGSFTLPQTPAEDSKWELELRSRDDANASFTLRNLPQTSGFTSSKK